MTIYQKFWDLIKETLKGKTFYRILFNWEVAKRCRGLHGVCIDLASGNGNASYTKYWNLNHEKFIRVDLDKNAKPNVVADLNKALPLKDDFVDNMFLFNSFYMIDNTGGLLNEIFRVLKKDGRLFLTSQFIKAEESFVPDLYRFSSRKLDKLLKEAGFNKFEIIPVGERFASAGNLFDFALGNFFLFRFIKIFIRFSCLFLDKIWPQKMRGNYPCPIVWFVVARK